MNPMKADFVQVGDLQMYYEREGSGEPLLLLHGATGCHGDWIYAGRDEFVRQYSLITPDIRGHGATNNPGTTITHRQCAVDTLEFLDRLGVSECRAIGVSMGGNILLHMATMQPDRIKVMVVVSATMYFPEQARVIMRQVPQPQDQPAQEWDRMRRSHKRGDEQIRALWNWTRSLESSYDDMNFTGSLLGTVKARTLIVYGDRDPLYPVEMGVEMYRAIPDASLWVVPNGSHGPIFGAGAQQFAQTALKFLGSPA
jgi:pimeloyl-ACP methyl ester carboxylesterase